MLIDVKKIYSAHQFCLFVDFLFLFYILSSQEICMFEWKHWQCCNKVINLQIFNAVDSRDLLSLQHTNHRVSSIVITGNAETSCFWQKLFFVLISNWKLLENNILKLTIFSVGEMIIMSDLVVMHTYSNCLSIS